MGGGPEGLEVDVVVARGREGSVRGLMMGEGTGWLGLDGCFGEIGWKTLVFSRLARVFVS